MRLVLAAALVSALVAGTAMAAEPDPSALVLRSSDVPHESVLDRDDSGLQSNAKVGTGKRARALIVRLGRITGYQAKWTRNRGNHVIVSRADVFREVAGARLYVKMASTELDRTGIKGLRRSVVRLGDEGWLISGKPTDEFAWVVWPSGRVSGPLLGWGIRPPQTLALARTQQRRIDAATR